ncbi:MAG TPA: DUF1707 domain-containing protein [Actinospica sp.]|nr:DUF1707 domain-containing protein [Actinospica sp.]
MGKEEASHARAADLELRASDADRERVAEVLRNAAGLGRISMDELDERLEAVYAARTYGELVPITRDLPVDDAVPPSPVPARAASAGPLVVGSNEPVGRGTAIAIMSGANRGGNWIVPRRFTAFAFWGGSVIDLREARFESRVTVIRAGAIMGGVQVLVPEGVRAEVVGLGIMGGFNESGCKPATGPNAPVVRVKGLAFWGGVLVRHMKRGNNGRDADSRESES